MSLSAKVVRRARHQINFVTKFQLTENSFIKEAPLDVVRCTAVSVVGLVACGWLKYVEDRRRRPCVQLFGIL